MICTKCLKDRSNFRPTHKQCRQCESDYVAEYRKRHGQGRKRRYTGNGFKNSAERDFGGLRESIIIRDGEKCVICFMTREEHIAKWDRDITVNHIDGNGRNSASKLKNNLPDNLETLCLSCHSRKDRERILCLKK